MRLQRQAPFRPLHRQLDRRLDGLVAPIAVHRLDEKVIELPVLERCRIDSLLRPHKLQFVAAPLDDLGSRLRADANPVDSRRRRKRSVGLYCNSEIPAMQRIDELAIELKHRLPAGDHDQALLVLLAPKRLDMAGKRVGARELAAALAIRSDEVRIAEAALRAGPVSLAPRPQIAPGEAQKH